MAEANGSLPPLTGYRVLDLTQPMGFHCTKLLADMGSDVVKVERPGGDPSRLIPPFKDDTPHPEGSLYFLHYNTNKRGITLNLHCRDGQAIFLQLVERSDVVLETYAPGTLDSLGLDYKTLRRANPAVVVASITPFGQTGPWRDYKATDIAGLALGNTMAVTGEPGEAPVTAPGELAYGMASVYAAYGIAVALYSRLETGSGQYIDVSMHECSAHIAGYAIPDYSYNGTKPARSLPREERGLYRVRDGHVRLSLFQAEQWRRMMEWMGRPEPLSDPRFDNMEFRRKNADAVHSAIGRFCMQFTKHEFYEEGQRRRIAVSPANTPVEFMESPHTQARGLFVEMEHPYVGKYREFGPIPGLSATPGRMTRPAPLIGQHNVEIYCGELGLSRQDLIALAGAGAI